MRTAATQKRNSELDELEKELGLDLLDTIGGDGKNGGNDGNTAEGGAGMFQVYEWYLMLYAISGRCVF